MGNRQPPPLPPPTTTIQTTTVPATTPSTIPPTTTITTTTTKTRAFTTWHEYDVTTSIDQLTSKSGASLDNAGMTSLGLSTIYLHSPPAPRMSFLSSYLLPLAIVLSVLLLVVAFVFFALLYRRRKNSLKRRLIEEGIGGSNHDDTALQDYSNSAFAGGSDPDQDRLHNDHIYVEHLDHDRKMQEFPDAMYASVFKAKLAITSPSENTTVIQGFPDDVFGDEDHYNLLFEDTPQILNLINANGYENHSINDHRSNRQQSYATITELPGLTYYYDDGSTLHDDDARSTETGQQRRSEGATTSPHGNHNDCNFAHDESVHMTSQVVFKNGDDVVCGEPVGTALDQNEAVSDTTRVEPTQYDDVVGSKPGGTTSDRQELVDGETAVYINTNDSSTRSGKTQSESPDGGDALMQNGGEDHEYCEFDGPTEETIDSYAGDDNMCENILYHSFASD